ncbi:acylneuraminate cytidylyltransferase family protein [Paenibacillus sp. NEAU-GSW1]|uniref:acylneuraminate cytidylyltransferase family protein n=1 Tax=Paenibacillus sp. NEAU-GSW1 TaxID=2682486 RepID=UPI0012E21009|nr:acylneuraminate cytidylyltransferase family protein [Paenibacillus sp. NEAU-GSW1]MUT65002.1 NTP transferase domain-containing protein [Paenibacillus sp. NEAU-GSW1]
MIAGKKVLGVIPARGGSKGVPGKNIRELAGKPLIAWTIEAAARSVYLDRVIISSDDDSIIQTAIAHGGDVPFKRPERLAQDGTSGLAPVVHALDELPGYDYVVLLQPTSPLRTVEDIDACIAQCEKSGAPVVSMTEPDKSPYWMFRIGAGDRLSPVMGHVESTLRQDLPAAFVLNGAIYVSDVEGFRKTESFLTEETTGYVMPKERSVDIDTLLDFWLCEAIIANKANN